MLIAGAGGLATQLLDDLLSAPNGEIVFWSETETKYAFLKEKFRMLTTDEEVVDYFNTHGKTYINCVGGIDGRRQVTERFRLLGGESLTYISPNSIISPYITVGKGTLILSRVEIEPGVVIGDDCLVNKTANIGHGCIIGSNCEIAPGVIITGEVEMRPNSFIGTRAVILPKVTIGENAIVGAGSIVKKDVPDNAVVSGEFATVKYFRK